MEETYNLSHLKELEAESIHIIREVAAEFENPVIASEKTRPSWCALPKRHLHRADRLSP